MSVSAAILNSCGGGVRFKSRFRITSNLASTSTHFIIIIIITMLTKHLAMTHDDGRGKEGVLMVRVHRMCHLMPFAWCFHLRAPVDDLACERLEQPVRRPAAAPPRKGHQSLV